MTVAVDTSRINLPVPLLVLVLAVTDLPLMTIRHLATTARMAVVTRAEGEEGRMATGMDVETVTAVAVGTATTGTTGHAPRLLPHSSLNGRMLSSYWG